MCNSTSVIVQFIFVAPLHLLCWYVPSHGWNKSTNTMTLHFNTERSIAYSHQDSLSPGKEISFARRQAASGFSLIELLIVVAVSVVVAAIAIPQVMTMLNSYRMSSSAKSLAYQLRMARFRAVSNYTLARLNCSTSATPASCQIETCTSQAGNGLCNTTSTAWTIDSGGAQPLPAAVYFGFGTIGASPKDSSGNPVQSTVAQSNPIAFNSRGLAVDISGTTQIPKTDNVLYIRDKSNQSNDNACYAVTVSSVGTVAVWQFSSATGSWSPR